MDDDEAVRDALFDLLQVEGMPARAFDGAAAFLQACGDFDCVITDVRMPEIDGIELQRRLRAGGSAMPVIYVTSCDEEVLRARAFQGGAAGWFTKPVDDAQLLGMLKAVLPSC
ncbi:response regulator [Sphingomonas sp. R-74633]|nr:response regulator [Sphingomonas sp. R-74633]